MRGDRNGTTCTVVNQNGLGCFTNKQNYFIDIEQTDCSELWAIIGF